MDSRTGELHPTPDAAKAAGVPEADIVELKGERRAVERVAGRVRMVARLKNNRRVARRRQQRASRRRNR